MSHEFNPYGANDLLRANPFTFSAMAFSLMMAWCLDCADAAQSWRAPLRAPFDIKIQGKSTGLPRHTLFS